MGGTGGSHMIKAPSPASWLPLGSARDREAGHRQQGETPLISCNCLAYDITCPQKNGAFIHFL